MTGINNTSLTSPLQWKKILQAVTLGAFAVAPTIGTTTAAQAVPPDHAPAHGYRARQNGEHPGRGSHHRHDDDDDYYDDDRRRRDYDNRYDGRYDDGRYDDYRNNNQLQTLTGVVVNDRNGDEFTVRASNGNRVRVRAVGGEPGRLDEGDTVRLRGRYTNGIFLARNVDITRNTSKRNDRNLGRYDGRYNDGYNYDYRNRGGYSGSYNGGYNNYDGTNVNFPATVIDTNERSNSVRVRGENGRTYTVYTRQADGLDEGDKVRIEGRSRNGVIYADKITDR